MSSETPYVSSIIFKYGDTDRVSADTKTVSEIQNRQGSHFLIDIIAESFGRVANDFDLNDVERTRMIDGITKDLREALRERL